MKNKMKVRGRKTKVGNKKVKLLEKFVALQIERYVRIHKQHEKELRYIG